MFATTCNQSCYCHDFHGNHNTNIIMAILYTIVTKKRWQQHLCVVTNFVSLQCIVWPKGQNLSRIGGKTMVPWWDFNHLCIDLRVPFEEKNGVIFLLQNVKKKPPSILVGKMVMTLCQHHSASQSYSSHLKSTVQETSWNKLYASIIFFEVRFHNCNYEQAKYGRACGGHYMMMINPTIKHVKIHILWEKDIIVYFRKYFGPPIFGSGEGLPEPLLCPIYSKFSP
jgi:hypothetical protein